MDPDRAGSYLLTYLQSGSRIYDCSRWITRKYVQFIIFIIFLNLRLKFYFLLET